MDSIEKAEEAAGRHLMFFTLFLLGALFFAFLAGALMAKGSEVWLLAGLQSISMTLWAVASLLEMLHDQRRITQM